MKRLIYLKKWTIVRPSCFAPKERSALKKKCRSRYISALKKSRPRDISTAISHQNVDRMQITY